MARKTNNLLSRPVQEAYRGYLIIQTIHGFSIQKSGMHISWAQSRSEAEATIDLLT